MTPKRRSMQTALLMLGFVAAGFGCALPGALLPAMLHSWQWTDARGGTMLMLVSAGSALAPLLIRRVPHSVIALGQALTLTGTFLWAIHFASPLLAAVAYGLGLGLSMTGISLSIARQSAASSRALTRLNVVWSVGAVIAPPAMTHALRISSPRGILLVVAAIFAVLAVLSATLIRETHIAPRGTLPASVAGIPFALLIATALTTGIEASCGGWLATYVQRSQHRLEGVVLAPTMFWAGLLVSRLIVSSSWRCKLQRIPVRSLALLATVGIASVVAVHSEIVVVSSAFLVGAGLGPLYPELLARVLRFKENTGIFTMAGVAPALMAYGTGLLSSASSSLRIGLCVPLAGAIVMLLAVLAVHQNAISHPSA